MTIWLIAEACRQLRKESTKNCRRSRADAVGMGPSAVAALKIMSETSSAEPRAPTCRIQRAWPATVASVRRQIGPRDRFRRAVSAPRHAAERLHEVAAYAHSRGRSRSSDRGRPDPCSRHQHGSGGRFSYVSAPQWRPDSPSRRRSASARDNSRHSPSSFALYSYTHFAGPRRAIFADAC
jgi:hypothetical protein